MLSKISPLSGVQRMRESNPQKAMEALPVLGFSKSSCVIAGDTYMCHGFLKKRLEPALVLG